MGNFSKGEPVYIGMEEEFHPQLVQLAFRALAFGNLRFFAQRSTQLAKQLVPVRRVQRSALGVLDFLKAVRLLRGRQHPLFSQLYGIEKILPIGLR